MAKVTFGEWAGFITKGTVRFQKNNRLVSESSVPPEVVVFIKKKLIKPTPVEVAEAIIHNESVPVTSTEVLPPKLGTVPDAIEVAQAQEILGDWNRQQTDPMAIAMPTDTGSNLEQAPIDEPIPEPQGDVADFMESVSIHTATLEDIALALYERFGIYSVYLRKMPVSDEINPLTGETFTKYHLGIAYQAAIRAQHSNVLNNPELGRVRIDASRIASESRRDAFVGAPTTLREAKEQDSFAYRTSVRGSSGYGQPSGKGEMVNIQDENGEIRSARLDPNEGSPSGMISVQPDGRFDLDEPLAEPPFRGKKIIRPDW